MKILMIIPTLSFGGAQNIAVGLAEEAYLKGHSIDFVSFYGKNDYEERLKKISCEALCLDYKKGFGFNHIISIRQLRKKLCEKIFSYNPDIIHTHLLLIKLVLFNKKFSIPLIDTQHDISPWWSNRSIDDKIKTFVEKKFAITTANKIVTISDSVKESLIKTLNVKDSKVSTIFNFVEKNNHPVKTSFSKDKFRMLVVSRIQIEKKGLDLLITIIEILIKSHKQKEIIITVVGDGPDMSEFKSIIDDKYLSSYFNFVGYQKDIYKYYSKSNLVLMPSRWEGFGLTAAEAAMAGRPIAGFNIPGLNEVVINQKTGVLVAPFKVDLLANVISDLISNPNKLKRLSSLALENAKIRFDKEKAFLNYEKQYYSLINEK